jgi:hypothetical protein
MNKNEGIGKNSHVAVVDGESEKMVKIFSSRIKG